MVQSYLLNPTRARHHLDWTPVVNLQTEYESGRSQEDR